MSRHPRYPYQSTNNAAPSYQPSGNSHHQLRNPWTLEQPSGLRPQDCRESQSTNSSSSSRTHRGPGPPQLWLHQDPIMGPGLYNHHQARAAHYTVDPHIEEGPSIVGTGNPSLLQPQQHVGTIVAAVTKVPAHHYNAPSSRAPSDRPVTPASSPGGLSGGGGALDGCGGHCVAFENFCYYCLQVIFVAGILTGVSLMIAGSVLRSQQRGGDLLVLVYIGCLIAMVCTLLLSVQCCVRRNVKRRKRALRTMRERGVGASMNRRTADTMIPLQDMGGGGTLKMNHVPQRAPQHQQYQPLLMCLVQQQQQHGNVVENQRLNSNVLGHPQYHHPQQSNYRSNTLPDTSARMDVSRSGIPWWRRHEAEIAESRH